MLKSFLMIGAVVLVACGSTPSGATDAGGGGGGGGDVGPGGGGDGGGATKKGLNVSSGLGLALADKPTKEEPSGVAGLVWVNKDETPVKGATVKVNGVAVPDEPPSMEGAYHVSKAGKIPNAVPGGRLELTASSGGESTSLILNCGGTDLVLKSPAEGTKVTAGQKLTVTWSGKTTNNSLGTIAPVVSVVAYDAATNSADSKYSSQAFVAVKGTATSAELTLPDVQDAPYDQGYLLTLNVPGDIATDAKEQSGRCDVMKRVHLVK